MSVRSWVVKTIALLLFNIVAVLVIVLLPGAAGVSIGTVLWGAIVLTVLSLFIKPLLHRWLLDNAGQVSLSRKLSSKVLSYVILYLVALIIWFLLVIFSGVQITNFLTTLIVPPLVLLAAWFIYDLVDDRLEARVAGWLGGPRR